MTYNVFGETLNLLNHASHDDECEVLRKK